MGIGSADFSDCLQLGVLVCVASVPVVTAGPAFAAGCRVVHRWRDGDSPPMVRTFRDEYVRQLRGGVPFTIGVAALFLALSVDIASLGKACRARGCSGRLAVLFAALAIVTLRTCSVVPAHTGGYPHCAPLCGSARTCARPALLAGRGDHGRGAGVDATV